MKNFDHECEHGEAVLNSDALSISWGGAAGCFKKRRGPKDVDVAANIAEDLFFLRLRLRVFMFPFDFAYLRTFSAPSVSPLESRRRREPSKVAVHSASCDEAN